MYKKRTNHIASKLLVRLIEQTKTIESVVLTEEDQLEITEMESEAEKALLTASAHLLEQYCKVVNDYKIQFVKWIKSRRANLNNVVCLTPNVNLHIPEAKKPTLISFIEFTTKFDKEYEEAEKRMELTKRKYDELVKNQKARQYLISTTDPTIDETSPFPDHSFFKVHSPYVIHVSIKPVIDEFCKKLNRQTNTEEFIKVLKWYKSEVYQSGKVFSGKTVKWVVEFPDETCGQCPSPE